MDHALLLVVRQRAMALDVAGTRRHRIVQRQVAADGEQLGMGRAVAAMARGFGGELGRPAEIGLHASPGRLTPRCSW